MKSSAWNHIRVSKPCGRSLRCLPAHFVFICTIGQSEIRLRVRHWNTDLLPRVFCSRPVKASDQQNWSALPPASSVIHIVTCVKCQAHTSQHMMPRSNNYTPNSHTWSQRLNLQPSCLPGQELLQENLDWWLRPKQRMKMNQFYYNVKEVKLPDSLMRFEFYRLWLKSLVAHARKALAPSDATPDLISFTRTTSWATCFFFFPPLCFSSLSGSLT